MKELLQYVCSQLESYQIPYMLSGSVALSVYTIPRFTRDIDLVIELNLQDVETLTTIFNKGFYFHRPSVEEEVRRKGFFNVIDEASGYKVDFVVRKQDAFRQMEFTRRRRDTVYGVEAWVVSVEDLIISKLLWIQDYQFSQQITDIEQLVADNSLDKDRLFKLLDRPA